MMIWLLGSLMDHLVLRPLETIVNIFSATSVSSNPYLDEATNYGRRRLADWSRIRIVFTRMKCG